MASGERREVRSGVGLFGRREPWLVFAVALGLYLLTLSENHTEAEDSLTYAKSLEIGGAALFHPNHILILPFAKGVEVVLRALGAAPTTLICLQLLNALGGAATLGLLARSLCRAAWSPIVRRSTVLLAGSAYAFWFYAVEAETYLVPLPLLWLGYESAWRGDLTPSQRSLRAALYLSLATLFHQQHVLSLLVVGAFCAISLARQRQNPVRALSIGATAAAVVLGSVYTTVGVSVFGARSAFALLSWSRGHASGGLWTPWSITSPIKAIVGVVRSILGLHPLFGIGPVTRAVERMFPSKMLVEEEFLAREMPGALSVLGLGFTALALGFGAALLGLLVWGPRARAGDLARASAGSGGSGGPSAAAGGAIPRALLLLGVGAYAAFNTVWEPQNIEFWIFPVLLATVWVGTFVEPRSPREQLCHLLLAASLFVANLTGSIVPQASAAGDYWHHVNAPLRAHVGPADTLISECGYICDGYLRTMLPGRVVRPSVNSTADLEAALVEAKGRVLVTSWAFEPPSFVERSGQLAAWDREATRSVLERYPRRLIAALPAFSLFEVDVHSRAAALPVPTWPFEPAPDAFAGKALLDLRFLNEAVAGESGFVSVSADGDFLLGSGAPVRFWAVNTSVGRERPFVPKPLGPQQEPDLTRHARFLAKRGVNLVRLHAHLEAKDPKAPGGIDEAERDWIWRTVAAMKPQGIYSVVSPYWSASTKLLPAWGVKGAPSQRAFGLLYFDPELERLYRGWLTELLSPPNPHTGVPLCQEPALAVLQLQNEDSLLFWTFDGIDQAQRERLERRYAAWLLRKYGAPERVRAAWGGEAGEAGEVSTARARFVTTWDLTQPASGGRAVRLGDQLEFLTSVMREFNAGIGRFVKEQLGCKQLINAGNWRTADGLRLGDAERYGYTTNDVDAVNRYFGGVHRGAHEGWAVVAGDRFTSPSVFDAPHEFPLNIRQTARRPMLVTESGWVQPNGRGAEAAFLVAAYQSLGGVDGFFWFATDAEQWAQPASANGYTPSQAKWTFGSPDVLGAFPAAALLYRKGYVRRGKPALVEERTLDDLWQRRVPLLGEEVGFDPNRDMSSASPRLPVRTALDPLAYFVGPVEVVHGGDPAKTAALDLSRYIDRTAGTVKSETGELEFDFRRRFARLDAPAAQGVVGFLDGVGLTRLSTVDVVSRNEFGAVLVVSLDGAPLSNSTRVLVQYTGPSRPTGWSERAELIDVGDGKKAPGFVVEDFGRAPHRVASARVRLTIRNPGLARATVLDPNGYARGAQPFEKTAEGIGLELPGDALYLVLER